MAVIPSPYSAAATPNTPWIPGDQGLQLAVDDVALFASTSLLTAGTVYLVKLPIRAAVTATNVVWAVTSSGNNTGGSTGTFSGLISPAGVLLSGSADVAAQFTSIGFASCPLTTPQSLLPAALPFVWATLVVNLGNTQPTLARSSGTAATINGGLTAATYRFATAGINQTALPNPITPASNSSLGLAIFAGIS